MQFELKKSIEILERTPLVLEQLLHGLSEEWLRTNEGENTWSPFDVVGHLIHGEKTDWITRMNIILEQGENRTFAPFDRFAQLKDNKGKSMDELLDAFKEARIVNLEYLRSKNLQREHFSLKGQHLALGEVDLRNLLATWVAHDLNHIGQIVRVMAKQYEEEVGPWKQYLGILK